MLSGRRLDLLDPSPLDIEIDDIAHGLARVARWNGQTRGDHAFSVAQHSLLVEAHRSACRRRCLAPSAARGAAARCAGICDRRHDLAVQDGGRRRLQGGRGAAAAAPSICASRCPPTRAPALQGRSSAPTRSRPISRRRCSPASRPPRRRAFFGRPRGISPDRFDLACRPAKGRRAFLNASRRSRGFGPRPDRKGRRWPELFALQTDRPAIGAAPWRRQAAPRRPRAAFPADRSPAGALSPRRRRCAARCHRTRRR